MELKLVDVLTVKWKQNIGEVVLEKKQKNENWVCEGNEL
jgi:hypothetical protein